MAVKLGEIFVSLGLGTRTFFKGWDEAKAKTREGAREIKKQMGEARDAGQLLNQMFGVQMPATVQKYVTALGPVRSALAAALPISLAAGFGIQLASAVLPKLGELVEKMNDWYGISKAQIEAQAELNKKLKTTAETLREIWDRIGAVSPVERAGRELAALQIRLRGLQAMREEIEARTRATETVGAPGFPGAQTVPTQGAMTARRALVEMDTEIKKVSADLEIARARVTEFSLSLGPSSVEMRRAGAALAEASERAREKALDYLGVLREQVTVHGMNAVELARHKAALLALTDAEKQEVVVLTRRLLLLDAFTKGIKVAIPKPQIDKADLVPPEIPVDPQQLVIADEALRKLMASLSKTPELLRPVSALVRDIRQDFEFWSQAGLAAIGDAVLGLTSWKSVARQILADLGRMVWYFLVLKPLMGALFGGGKTFGFGGGGAAGFFQSANPLPGTPGSVLGGGLQHGGFAMPGRSYLVGEVGPERLTMLGRGGMVTPVSGGGKSGITVIQHNDLRGADIGTQARLAAGLDALAIQGALQALRDAEQRRA